MNSEAEQSVRANKPLALAAVLTMVGGLAAALASVVDVPLAVLVAALTLFLAGTVIALVLAYRQSRAEDVSVLGAIGRALKLVFRWAVALMP